MNNISWDLVRSFIQTAKDGSLSAAAKNLGVSQPTLSRNIQRLEQQTKLQLFQRTTKGLSITEAGEKMMNAAKQMEEASDLFQRQISGLSDELQGDIRISVNEIVGIYLLPPALTSFREKHPKVHIEIEITNQTTSLNKRDADIALRMYRPKQPDLIARRLPDLPLGFFASKNYIEQHGAPQNFDEFKQHTIIGFDRGVEFIQAAKNMGQVLSIHDFELRTDALPMQINLARFDGGIVGTHIGLAKQYPELEQIMGWLPLPALEFWIVCHADTAYNARIRELTKFLGQWFSNKTYTYQI